MSSEKQVHNKRFKEEQLSFKTTGSYSKEILVINPLDIIPETETLKCLSFKEFCYHLLMVLENKPNEEIDKSVMLKVIDNNPPPVAFFVPHKLVKDVYGFSEHRLNLYRKAGLLYSRIHYGDFIYPFKQLQELSN